MKNLRGFIALDDRGRLGVILRYDEQDKMHYGYSIEMDDHSLNTKMSSLIWACKHPHVLDSVSGIKAKAGISEKAFSGRSGRIIDGSVD